MALLPLFVIGVTFLRIQFTPGTEVTEDNIVQNEPAEELDKGADTCETNAPESSMTRNIAQIVLI